MSRQSHHRSPIRIDRSTRLGIYLVGIGIWVTGSAWLLLHFFFEKQGEFGTQVHPLQPFSLKLHGLFSFASIWLLGLLWGKHISAAWPLKRRRLSGGVLTGVLLLLMGSGYLLYYGGEEGFRSSVATLHWIIGLALPCTYGWHRLKRKNFTRKQIRVDQTVSGFARSATGPEPPTETFASNLPSEQHLDMSDELGRPLARAPNKEVT